MAAAAAAAARTLLLCSSQSRRKVWSFSFNNIRLHASSVTANKYRPLITRCLQSSTGRRNVVDILEERGLLDSLTSDTLRANNNSNNITVYCGFDPTAQSLHLGNLLGIIVLSWFQRCGHKAVAVIGGATARIGDPSGKSLERPELDLQSLEKNTQGITDTITTIFNNNNTNKIVVLNNYDWWKEFRLLDFLKQVGRYARVGTMIAKESVKKRLESQQGMSYTELTYQLLQAYDFLYLLQNHAVNVQIGGSDQWGNITAGTELIRKIILPDSDSNSNSNAASAYGLTFPLLLKSDGTKFGKSEDGAIWLSPSMLSPYKFYQYFFSVPDADVIRFLKMLTFLDIAQIHHLDCQMNKPGYVPNAAQRLLAEQVTRFVHGQDGLNEALKATEALRPGAETKLDWKAIEGIAKDVPSCTMAYDQVLNLFLIDLSVSAGLLDSKSAARRLLKQGGLYLNNSRVDNESKRIEHQDIVDGKVLLLSAGKKSKVIMSIEPLTLIRQPRYGA